MTSYNLKQITASTFQITSGGRKVGHVASCPKGFVARIGQRCEVRNTAQGAFEAVALLALGFKSVAELQAHNQAARAKTRAFRAVARHAIGEFYAGNSEPFLDLLKKI
jgi:hypothetical protein